jgi:hypothetical protein
VLLLDAKGLGLRETEGRNNRDLAGDDGSRRRGVTAGDETEEGEGHGGREEEDAGIGEHWIVSEPVGHRRLLLGG